MPSALGDVGALGVIGGEGCPGAGSSEGTLMIRRRGDARPLLIGVAPSRGEASGGLEGRAYLRALGLAM